jgi:hypothetical protein
MEAGFRRSYQSVVEQIETGLAERAVILANVERDRAEVIHILGCCSRSDGVRPSRWTMISRRLNAHLHSIQTGVHIRRPRWSFGDATAELMQHADGGDTGSMASERWVGHFLAIIEANQGGNMLRIFTLRNLPAYAPLPHELKHKGKTIERIISIAVGVIQ